MIVFLLYFTSVFQFNLFTSTSTNWRGDHELSNTLIFISTIKDKEGVDESGKVKAFEGVWRSSCPIREEMEGVVQRSRGRMSQLLGV